MAARITYEPSFFTGEARTSAHEALSASTSRLDKQPLRRRRAIERLQAAWTPILNSASAEELEQIASLAEFSVREPSVPEQQNDLVVALSHARARSPQESALLELQNQLRSFQERRNLLRGALTTTEVAKLLGTSRQTPHDRANAGSLLALSEHGKLLFPPWQFDPAGPHGVVDGLPRVLMALTVSPFGKARWLTRTNPALDARAPIEVLNSGEVKRVVEAARSVGVS